MGEYYISDEESPDNRYENLDDDPVKSDYVLRNEDGDKVSFIYRWDDYYLMQFRRQGVDESIQEIAKEMSEPFPDPSRVGLVHAKYIAWNNATEISGEGMEEMDEDRRNEPISIPKDEPVNIRNLCSTLLDVLEEEDRDIRIWRDLEPVISKALEEAEDLIYDPEEE